jgi:chromosome partitioning protein
VHLAVHAQAAGVRCLLVDMDPQESASRWYDRREAPDPALVTATAGALPDVIAAARADGVGLVVVDTPPHAGAQIDQAVAVADLVLVPVKPTPMDLDALPGTAAIVRRHARPAGIVLTSAPPARGTTRAGIVTEARNHLAAEYPDFPVLDVELGHRTAYYYALIDGRAVGEFEPGGKAAAEVAAVYAWCAERLPALRHPTAAAAAGR